MSVNCATAIVIGFLGGYIVAMDWIRIPRWNENIRRAPVRPRVTSSLWHGILATTFALANAFVWRWGILIGGIWFTVLLGIELTNWWVPYLFGVVKGEVTEEVFASSYSANIRFLPRIDGHTIVPDAQHVLMQAVTLAAALLSYVSFYRAW